MGVAHVVTPGSPRPCHQPNRNPLHPDPGDDAGDGNVGGERKYVS